MSQQRWHTIIRLPLGLFVCALHKKIQPEDEVARRKLALKTELERTRIKRDHEAGLSLSASSKRDLLNRRMEAITRELDEWT